VLCVIHVVHVSPHLPLWSHLDMCGLLMLLSGSNVVDDIMFN